MPMTDEQFVCEYLERIGHNGSLEPCLDTLRTLQQEHVFRIPFENLDILRRVPPSLDRDFLFERIIRQGRGGVCYELNTLFYYLLSALGFSVCQIGGRNYMNSPLTGHAFNLVHLEQGDHTADVGYGDSAVPPLPVTGGRVAGYHALWWIEPEGEEFLRLYQSRDGGEVQAQYQFSLQPRTREEFLQTFRFSAAPGNTIFSQRPICVCYTPQGKISLRKGVLTVEEENRVVEQRPVAPGAETERCLREYFALSVPGNGCF